MQKPKAAEFTAAPMVVISATFWEWMNNKNVKKDLYLTVQVFLYCAIIMTDPSEYQKGKSMNEVTR